MTSLKKQTVNGIKWLVGLSFISRIISLGTTIVLARILNPATFGLFSLAFIAIDTLGLFKSMGFDSALIRRKDDVEKAANTAFFIIPVLGVSIYLILAISAPVIGKFLNNQEVVGVVRALGVIFIISCFGNVPRALLEKSMQFKNISKIEISTGIIYSITAIILAISGVGIWSLVFAYVLKTFCQNIMFWVFSKWHPRLEFDRKIAFEMFHFGKFLFLGGVVWFLKMNLDNLLVGKLLGVAALGLYAIAFNLANFARDYFGGKVQRVIFPAYSKLQGNLDDLKRASFKVFKHVSLIALPFGVGLIFLAEELLSFVYGQKWIGAISVLKILAVAGVFNSLSSGLGGVFLACGKPKIVFWITAMQVTIFLIFIVPMAKLFGINGVGIVVGASSFIAFIVSLSFQMKILNFGLKQVYLNLKPALISSLIMALSLILIKNFIMPYNLLISLRFLILFSFAIAVYVYSLHRIERNFIIEMKKLVLSQ
ncbi:MAG: lipopolysaccharide biosynthesis protein [Candidatus Omnitrophica bacterium]|nr:lipopolysaccharide biosynthesis protein [Candidatus Omnitrophota bacterium]